MALGVVLPAWVAGILAVLVHAAVADGGLASAIAVFFATGAAVAVLLGTLGATRRPMRPIESTRDALARRRGARRTGPAAPPDRLRA